MPGGLLLAISTQPRGVSSCHNINNVWKHIISLLDMHVQNGLCDYLTYAAAYAALLHVVPGIKLAFNASHDNGSVLWLLVCDTTVLAGDHPFECEFCGSCFRDDGTLRGHKRIHTGEKPYECNSCGKRFSLKHQLETHYRVHTGESSEEGAWHCFLYNFFF